VPKWPAPKLPSFAADVANLLQIARSAQTVHPPNVPGGALLPRLDSNDHRRVMNLATTFDGLSLVCPRCRHVDTAGRLVVHRLLAEGTRRAPVLGQLSDVLALVCSACRARYPVVQGVPIVLRSADAIDFEHAPPFDPTGTPATTWLAAVSGQNPGAPVARFLARLGRWAWASFRDWMDAEARGPFGAGPIHAVEVMAWLEALGEDALLPKAGIRGILGCGPGREAWESNRATLLVDAHLPSLLLARRLIEEGSVEVLLPRDATRWRTVRVTSPAPPSAPIALLCADVLDPPFSAGVLASVVASNVLDSVSDPALAFRQLAALTSGRLTVTSPFAWRPDVTPCAHWLESLATEAEVAAEDVLIELGHHSGLELLARKELLWTLRTTEREAVSYQSLGLAFRKLE
jgi:uncharacterized protein YbaR (Trm112 family)